MKRLAAMVILAIAPAASAQFVGLGMLPGEPGSGAVDISADGQTIIGNSLIDANSVGTPWRWTYGGGLEALPFPSGSRVTSVSDDGSAITVVGANGSVYLWHALLVQELPLVAGAVVSGDGQTVFGQMFVGGNRHTNQAAKWTAAAGLVQLPDGPSHGGGECIWLYTAVPISPVAANQDGTLATGTLASFDFWGCGGEGDLRWMSLSGSFMWSPGAGTAVRTAFVYGMSSDGSVLLQAGTPLQRVDGDNPPEPLVGLNASNNVTPMLSGDGQTAISGDLIWDAIHGTRTLEQAFAFSRLDTTGWSNFAATGLAYGGTVLCGFATDPAGATEAWFADLGGCGTADFNGDGAVGTDADIEAFFACLAGDCCATCWSADFNGDGAVGTDADIESFFRVLAGGSC
jgi:hypothetical protein